MDKFSIHNIIQNNTDRNRYNAGYMYFKRSSVKDFYCKNEDDVSTFYGTVIDDYANYTSLLMINNKTRAILNYSCDCRDFISSDNQPRICAHIVATVLKGLEGNNNEQCETNEGIIDPSISLTIKQSRNGYIGLDLQIEGIDKNQYRQVFNSYKENKKLYKIPGGGYLNLENKDLEHSFKLIDNLSIYFDFDNMKIPNNKAIYLENFIEDLDFVDGKKYASNIAKRYKLSSNKDYEVPTNLNATLRDYQIKGYNYLKTLASYEFGGILADEMGLGKTLQAITFLLSNENKKSIVITPTSLIYNWKSEIEKFAPTLKVGLAHGNKINRENVIQNNEHYDIILTTYNTYKNDQDKYEKIHFDYCIIDEAQNIKNPDSLISRSIKKVNAKVKFALTGTPIENNLVELWSIFDFVMPGYLYNKQTFKRIFEGDNTNISELKKMIQPFILRRSKADVIKELPEKIEHKYYVELEKEHKRAYNGFVKLVKNKLEEYNDGSIAIFSYLTKLRQLALAPDIMVKNYKGKNSKIDLLMNLINENKDRKILVFSQFTKVLELIGKRLNEENINYSYLDGKTKAEQRLALVDEFNKDEDKKIFLISLKAGGTGLNLTSASMVVHFDPLWNPSVENQATDRAHRIGQKNVVDVVKLISKNTVEEKVIELQEEKKDLIDSVMDNELENSKILRNLSKDELMDLFI